MKGKTLSIVIPCYNEKSSVGKVIAEIKKCNGIEQIIVVDDGSDLPTKQILKSIKGIKLITLPQNKGKTAAMKYGADAAKSDYVFFIDADLIGFKAEHVKKVQGILDRKNIDMMLCKRQKELFLSSLTGFSTAYTGERAVSKRLLLKHKDIFENKGYLFEPAINKIFFGKYNTCIVELRGLGQKFKIQKQGLKGLLNDWKMYLDYIRFLGIMGLIYQLRHTKWMEKNALEN